MAVQCVSILQKFTFSIGGYENLHETLCFENEELVTKYLSQKYPNRKIEIYWKHIIEDNTKIFESEDGYTYILMTTPILNETDLKEN